MFWIIQKYLTEKVEELGNNLPQGKFVALCIYLFYVIQGFHYFFRLEVLLECRRYQTISARGLGSMAKP